MTSSSSCQSNKFNFRQVLKLNNSVWTRSFWYNWPFMHFRYLFTKINAWFEKSIMLCWDCPNRLFETALREYSYCHTVWLTRKPNIGLPRYVKQSHNSAQVFSFFENIFTIKSSFSLELQTRSGLFSLWIEWTSFDLENIFWTKDDFSLTGSLYQFNPNIIYEN